MERAPDPLRASVLSHEYDRCWSAEHMQRLEGNKLPPVQAPAHKPSVGTVSQIKSRLSLLAEKSESRGHNPRNMRLSQQGRTSQMLESFSTPVLQEAGSRPHMTQMQDTFALEGPSRSDMEAMYSLQNSTSVPALPSASASSLQGHQERKLTRKELENMIERLSKPRKQPTELLNLPEITRHSYVVTQAAAGNSEMAGVLERVASRHRDATPQYKMLYKDEANLHETRKGDRKNKKRVAKEEVLTSERQAKIRRAFQNHLISLFGNLDEAWAIALDPEGFGALGWTTFVAACGRHGIAFDTEMKLLFKCCADAEQGLVTLNSLSDGFDLNAVKQEKTMMLAGPAASQVRNVPKQTPALIGPKQTPALPEITEEAQNAEQTPPALMQIAAEAADSPQQNLAGTTGEAQAIDSIQESGETAVADDSLPQKPESIEEEVPEVEDFEDSAAFETETPVGSKKRDDSKDHLEYSEEFEQSDTENPVHKKEDAAAEVETEHQVDEDGFEAE